MMRKREAERQNKKLYRVYAESIQLPYIFCWANDQFEALDWSKQQPAEDWYEHETKPHFMQNFKAEKIKNVDYHLSDEKKVPCASDELE